MKKLICLALVALVLGGALAGCNTIAGMGRDIQKAGDTIEDAARKR